MRLFVYGKTSDDKGHQLEALMAAILKNMGCDNVTLNERGSGGNEIDVTAYSVIVRESKDDDIANVSKDDPKELSERQELIIGLIKGNDLITIQQMAQKTKVSEKTIKREFATLQEKGIFTREGGRKEGKWVIIVK